MGILHCDLMFLQNGSRSVKWPKDAVWIYEHCKVRKNTWELYEYRPIVLFVIVYSLVIVWKCIIILIVFYVLLIL